MKCKVCGNKMVLRHRKRDGHIFFGCSAYPKCTHTENHPDDEDDEYRDLDIEMPDKFNDW